MGFLRPPIPANADGQMQEFHIKAGFIYKFLFFTEWPADAFASDKAPIRIGIVGRNPFGTIFKKVENSLVDGRRLRVKVLGTDPPLETLKQCHLLFFSSSLENEIESRLQPLKKLPVLTVSDTRNFIHRGGMIHFVTEGDKVSFVINRTAAAQVGIAFRYRLLRLAAEVVENNHSDQD